jgi:hypothetical protein
MSEWNSAIAALQKVVFGDGEGVKAPDMALMEEAGMDFLPAFPGSKGRAGESKRKAPLQKQKLWGI